METKVVNFLWIKKIFALFAELFLQSLATKKQYTLLKVITVSEIPIIYCKFKMSFFKLQITDLEEWRKLLEKKILGKQEIFLTSLSE